MRHFDIALHGSGLQLFDSAGFEVPEDYNVPFPRNDKYLCIPTQPDHIGGISLDIYENESFPENKSMHQVFEGDIYTDTGILIVETSLVGEICEIRLKEPGTKRVQVMANRNELPNHITLVVSE